MAAVWIDDADGLCLGFGGGGGAVMGFLSVIDVSKTVVVWCGMVGVVVDLCLYAVDVLY